MGIFGSFFKKKERRPAFTHRDTLCCAECLYLERPECSRGEFWASNLRRCRATGAEHWTGDNADECGRFCFRDADRR